MSMPPNMPCIIADDHHRMFGICGLVRVTHTIVMACLGCSWYIYSAAFWRPQQHLNNFRTWVLQCKCYVSYWPGCMSKRDDTSETQKRLQQLDHTMLDMSCLQKKMLTNQ